MENLISRYKYLLSITNIDFVRYLHDKINWKARLISIVGTRGVGKTTLLLQRIKIHLDTDKTMYVNADDIYFTENRLFDLAETFYQNGGKHLFIDEIHKYADWSKELKMMYDYFPDLQVVFTGSSILDIYKGSDDLSRRALSYILVGLSFREYLNMSQKLNLPVYSFKDILANKIELPIAHPLPLFKEYLQSGYYPFHADPDFTSLLIATLNQTLENDIPIFANMNMATTRKLKQLLYIVAQSVPFKPNVTKIATIIGVHRNQVNDYFYYMEKAGLINRLNHVPENIYSLGKIEKIYLNNPNLIYALALEKLNIGNLRETFFFNQMQVNQSVYASQKADFLIDGFTFEVGGKTKSQKQISDIPNAFVVKDDIEYGYQNVLPLWAFGFNY
jgi:predicted AAA+ superfamily ATPase